MITRSYDEQAQWEYSPVTFVLQIRKNLRHLEPNTLLELKCFNKEEADAVTSMLTIDEMAKVARVSWLEFKERK